MSLAQELDTLVRETKIKVTMDLSRIISAHEAPQSTYTNLDDDISLCLLHLDMVNRFILTHSLSLPPQIAQLAKRAMGQLKTTIFEVKDTLRPPAIFNVEQIWNQTVEQYKIQGETSIIEQFRGVQQQNQEVKDHSHNLYGHKEISTQKQTPVQTPRQDDIRQHLITDISDTLMIIMTARQLANIITTKMKLEMVTTNISADINNSTTQIIKTMILDYKPNSIIWLSLANQPVIALATPLQDYFTHLQSSYRTNHQAIITSLNFQNDDQNNPSDHSQPIHNLSLYVCDIPNEYTSQVTDFASLQPPLIIKNVQNSIIVQFGIDFGLHLKLKAHDHSTNDNYNNKITNLALHKNQSYPYSFASVTAQNINMSSLILPLIDSSLHITKMTNCLTLVRCHQLRLHHITSSLFATCKNSTLLSTILDQHDELQCEVDRMGINLTGITPNDRLEPIIENSQDLLFTPYPFPSEISYPNLVPHLRTIRAQLLTIYDFDSFLTHREKDHMQPEQQHLPPKTEDLENNLTKLNYSYLDEHPDQYNLPRIFSSLSSIAGLVLLNERV